MKNRNVDVEIFQYNSFVFGRFVEISEELQKLENRELIKCTLDNCNDDMGMINNLIFKVVGKKHLSNRSTCQIGYNTSVTLDSKKPFLFTAKSVEAANNFIKGFKNSIDEINAEDFKIPEPKEELIYYPHGSPVQIL